MSGNAVPAQVNRKEIGFLPDGWKWGRLGELARTCSGTTPSRSRADYYLGKIPWVKTTELRDSVIDDTEEHVSVVALRDTSLRLLPPGTLLIAMYGQGQTRGRTGLLAKPATTNQACFAILPEPSLFEPSFLQLWFRYSYKRIREYTDGRGGNQPNLNGDLLRQELIPLPPLREQRRIASLFQEQDRAVQRARAAAEAQLEAAESLIAARLRTVFYSATHKWSCSRLGDLAEIVSGVTLGRKLPDNGIRSIGYLRVANVKDGHLSLEDVYETPATENEIAKLRLCYGDLLLTEGGDPDKLGRGTFWQNQVPECIHQNHIFRVRFDLARFSPGFVAAQIGSAYGKRYFAAHAKQTTGIATINRTVLGGFPLLTPPLDVQEEIVRSLDGFTETARQIIHGSREQLRAIEKLPAALLRGAFNGEL